MADEKQSGPKQDAKSEASQEDLSARVQHLEAALAASRAALPLSLIPEHGAGPGMEVNDTWSQAEQEAAQATEAAPVR